AASSLLAEAAARSLDVAELHGKFAERQQLAEQYIGAYRHYCWEVESVADLKLAPFHLLASEGKVHSGRDHLWHMETLARICKYGVRILLATSHRVVDLNDESSVSRVVEWWEELT